jgi:hypothetical protein
MAAILGPYVTKLARFDHAVAADGRGFPAVGVSRIATVATVATVALVAPVGETEGVVGAGEGQEQGERKK